MVTGRPASLPRIAAWLAALLSAALLVTAPGASASGSRVRAAERVRPSRAQHSCPDADTPATAASHQAMRAAVVCLINRQRTARHLPALHDYVLLDRSAQLWTNAMVATGRFTHGSDFAARITAVGFHWSSAGENIATGVRTPRQVVAAWVASADHCRNILDPRYADVGTGISARPVGRFAGGPSTWTQDFGLPIGRRAPSSQYGPADGCPYVS